MTRHPYGPDELDRVDPELDHIAEELERYAAARSAEPSLGLASRIRAAVDDEPEPRRAWWAAFGASVRGLRGPARAAAVMAMGVAVIVGALALGELAERARQDNVGTSPSPSPIFTPSATPTRSPSPSDTPSPSPSPSPSASPSDEATVRPSPTASDDDGEVETPEPSESDHSGPGGGGDDNSGPGGGG